MKSKKNIKLKLTLKKKLQKRLTFFIQKNKVFKNQWSFKKSKIIVKSAGYGFLNSKKIEMCRIMLRQAISTKKMRKSALTKILINSHMNRVFTKKSSNQRMGKGKGQVKGRFSTVFPGKILFETKVGKKKPLLSAIKILNDRLPFKIFCVGNSFFK